MEKNFVVHGYTYLKITEQKMKLPSNKKNKQTNKQIVKICKEKQKHVSDLFNAFNRCMKTKEKTQICFPVINILNNSHKPQQYFRQYKHSTIVKIQQHFLSVKNTPIFWKHHDVIFSWYL